MSTQDERGVPLREPRSVSPFVGRGSSTQTVERPEAPTAPRSPRPDPAVPAEIVARARAAMLQANRPGPAEPTDHEGEQDAASLVEADDAVAATSVDSVDSGDRTAPAAWSATSETEQDTTSNDAAQLAPMVRHPWEKPDPDGDTTPAVDEPSRAVARQAWSGYNPDYVADRMVPMIHARATTGWRGWLGLPPSRSELRHLELQAAMCVNFGQPVKIVLANPRGYAGKTVLTVALAGALGRARGGRVCAFENHELRGVMALRTVANGTQRTTRDFINDLSEMTPDQVRHADLSRYVRHQLSGNFDAMVTARSYEKQLDGAEYRAASALLERFYEVIVVDTANNEAHDAFQAAVEDATVLVVPTKWRPTHITPATQMLNDMAALSPRHQLLVQNAVVVASNGAAETVPGAREMALPMFSSLAYRVLEIPPDPHIEADRPIVHDQLRPQTRTALDQLGAAVCAAARKNIEGMARL